MPRNEDQTGVEIKVSFDDQQVVRALDELGLDDDGEPRRIGFWRTPPSASRSLFSTRGSCFESARSTTMTTTRR
jgi:hypothetical protein